MIEKNDYVKKLGLEKGVKGDCRTWTSEAIKKIKEYARITGENITVEAREVEIEPGLSHTFIRLILPENQPFILDGTGAGKYGPFFGPESDAPEHLRNSLDDMLNHYLK